ncbi:MAG TPA: tetratricopeptide repeat protein [Anaerolineaceae bacterium]|nr:tetratricopeptide repeat protein [Anaerolineaceae bacterium]
MFLTGRQPHFRKQKHHSNIYRVMALTALIVAGLVVFRDYKRGEVKPLFSPTATPTRTFVSYEQEGDTYFEIGKLDCAPETPDACAIGAYKNAVAIDPNNAVIYTRLARIQAYSIKLQATNEERLERLQEALASADQAVKIDPDDSSAHAVRAFVLDWLASIPQPLVTIEQRDEWLYEAEKEATKAFTLDETNTLALAYYAEILVDQGKLTQAEQKINQALESGKADMDIYRVHGYVLEYMGAYKASLEEYEKAAEVNPNMTFLYIDIGNKYRHLANINTSNDQKTELYGYALENFQKAVDINARLGIQDPTPYIAIANTYSQMGEFFVAVNNMRKVLQLNPGSASAYAQLGMVYHRSRNYEGSVPAFKCGLEGCTAEEACEVRQCDPDTDKAAGNWLDIKGLSLDDDTWIYYTTYGSVMAGLHKPSLPRCDHAMEILSMVRAMYGTNDEIMAIVKPSEEICEAAGYSLQGAALPSPTPATSETPPASTEMPTAAPLETLTAPTVGP